MIAEQFAKYVMDRVIRCEPRILKQFKIKTVESVEEELLGDDDNCTVSITMKEWRCTLWLEGHEAPTVFSTRWWADGGDEAPVPPNFFSPIPKEVAPRKCALLSLILPRTHGTPCSPRPMARLTLPCSPLHGGPEGLPKVLTLTCNLVIMASVECTRAQTDGSRTLRNG